MCICEDVINPVVTVLQGIGQALPFSFRWCIKHPRRKNCLDVREVLPRQFSEIMGKAEKPVAPPGRAPVARAPALVVWPERHEVQADARQLLEKAPGVRQEIVTSLRVTRTDRMPAVAPAMSRVRQRNGADVRRRAAEHRVVDADREFQPKVPGSSREFARHCEGMFCFRVLPVSQIDERECRLDRVHAPEGHVFHVAGDFILRGDVVPVVEVSGEVHSSQRTSRRGHTTPR